MSCQALPNTIASNFSCDIKYINRNHIRAYISINLSELLYDFWLHIVYFYRFNGMTYSNFPIDRWENVCGWKGGTAKSYMFDWLIKKAIQYSNFNHTCPYVAKIDNMSTTNFGFEQLLPAGKYRLDGNFTNGDRKNVIMMSKLFMTISDIRVERF